MWLFAYLCVCSFFVGSGGVIFVSEKGLQLSDAAAHSGYLRADTRETIWGVSCDASNKNYTIQFRLFQVWK